MAEENNMSGQMNPSAGPSKNTLMAILAYIGPLVVVSYLVAKDETFVKFHIKQGLVLLVGWVAIWFIAFIIPWFGFFSYWVWGIIKLAFFVLAILGIINAAQGKEKELPVVGRYSKYLTF